MQGQRRCQPSFRRRWGRRRQQRGVSRELAQRAGFGAGLRIGSAVRLRLLANRRLDAERQFQCEGGVLRLRAMRAGEGDLQQERQKRSQQRATARPRPLFRQLAFRRRVKPTLLRLRRYRF